MSSNPSLTNFRLKLTCEVCGVIYWRLDGHTCDVDFLVAKYVTPHMNKEA